VLLDVYDRTVDDRVDCVDVARPPRGIAVGEVREREHRERARHQVPLRVRAAQLGEVPIDIAGLPEPELTVREAGDIGSALEPEMEGRDPDQRSDQQAGHEPHVSMVATRPVNARRFPASGRNW